MKKIIKINQTILEIVTQYPEIKEIMRSLGFERIVDPLMIQTVGKFMTIKSGSKMRDIDLNIIKEKLAEKGFELEE
jgi:hypothetical protein